MQIPKHSACFCFIEQADGKADVNDHVVAHFGLGKALEDLGDYEASMRHYDSANQISRDVKIGPATFDRDAYSAYIDHLISLNPVPGARQYSTGDMPVPI